MSFLTWEHDGELFCALTTGTGTGADALVHFELSEARIVPPASPAPGPAAVTVLAYAAEEEKPPEVFFDAARTLPFAVLQRFVATVAAQLPGAGS